MNQAMINRHIESLEKQLETAISQEDKQKIQVIIDRDKEILAKMVK
jgi:hypothetical protein